MSTTAHRANRSVGKTETASVPAMSALAPADDATSADSPAPARKPHEADKGMGSLNSKLNWLRAAVLGANDGIISTAGIVMGVAGATIDRSSLLIAGLAGLVAGALSMAGGE